MNDGGENCHVRCPFALYSRNVSVLRMCCTFKCEFSSSESSSRLLYSLFTNTWRRFEDVRDLQIDVSEMKSLIQAASLSFLSANKVTKIVSSIPRNFYPQKA